MIPREGAYVRYVGDPGDGLDLGTLGRVLANGGEHASHVMWDEGALQGEVTLTPHLDIVAVAEDEPLLAHSVTEGSAMAFEARRVYDADGCDGLLTELHKAGHLASFNGIAHEALNFVAGRIRSDTSIRMVLADLDDEEADSFVSLASRVLLRDAFGG